jgi:hypothetical protein
MNDNTILRWLVAGSLLAFGALVIAYNIRLAVRAAWTRITGRKFRYESFAPIGGPLVATIGCFASPSPAFAHLAWLPWVLDPSTYILLASLPLIVRELFARPKTNSKHHNDAS